MSESKTTRVEIALVVSANGEWMAYGDNARTVTESAEYMQDEDMWNPELEEANKLYRIVMEVPTPEIQTLMVKPRFRSSAEGEG